MAYYSGQASNYADLLNSLVNACVAEGWTWADGILSKDETFVQVSVSTTTTISQGPGVILRGGLSKTGATLNNPSGWIRLGPDAGISPLFSFVFPMMFQIFIFNNPNEVFLVVNYEIDKFSYLAFGQSTLTGYKTWIESSVAIGFAASNTSNSPINISETGGGQMDGNFTYAYPNGFFWQTMSYGGYYHCGISESNGTWVYPYTNNPTLSAVQSVYNLIQVSPSKWSSGATLIPIIVIAPKSSNKCAIATIINNARYIRIDNFEPNQTLVLGPEKWKVFPFFRKNTLQRNGGFNINHTGTFGWAIRYDGP